MNDMWKCCFNSKAGQEGERLLLPLCAQQCTRHQVGYRRNVRGGPYPPETYKPGNQDTPKQKKRCKVVFTTSMVVNDSETARRVRKVEIINRLQKLGMPLGGGKA